LAQYPSGESLFPGTETCYGRGNLERLLIQELGDIACGPVNFNENFTKGRYIIQIYPDSANVADGEFHYHEPVSIHSRLREIPETLMTEEQLLQLPWRKGYMELEALLLTKGRITSISTCPDIAFAVTRLSRLNQGLGRVHYEATNESFDIYII
jgi:hypothetical protein